MMAATKNTKTYYNTEIPDDWEVKKGEDLSLKITKGSSPNWQGFQYQDNGVLFVTSENVRDGFLDISQPKYLPIAFNDKLKNSILQKGDILINIVGASIGRCCIYNLDTVANINQAVCILRPNETTIKEYVSYFLQLPKSIERLLGTQSDSARPNLTLEDIRNFKILLPPLTEQKAIAKVLATWDEAITKTQTLINQKELSKKWLMQNLLTGKKRLKGFEEDFKEYKVDQLFDTIARYVEWNENDLYKLVSIRRRFGGLFLRGDLLGEQISVKKLKRINTGDFLISKRQVSHGAWAVVPSEFHDAKVSDEYDCLQIKDENKLISSFWLWFCQLPILRHYAFLDSNGVHIEKLIFDFDQFKKRKVSIPKSIKEQTAIAQVLVAADTEIQLLKTKTERLKEQKKGLMQMLLTGKQRLNISKK